LQGIFGAMTLKAPITEGNHFSQTTMTIFLITFVCLYGGMHFYLFMKIKSAIALGAGSAIGLILFFGIMIFAPFAVRILEKHDLDALARFMSYVGYIWMGVLFIYFFASLMVDIYRCVVYAGAMTIDRRFSLLQPSPLWILLLPLLVSIVVNTYGYFDAKNPRIERISIESDKITEKMDKVRIVQISDVHIGLIVGEKRMKQIVDAIKEADPDILVSTGDLIDGQMNHLAPSMMLLKGVEPRYGKFAVLGNHEFYAGFHESIAFIKNAGFTILRGEGTTVAGLINVAGVDDPVGRRLDVVGDVSEAQLISALPRQYFTLLLKHQPVVDANATPLFDLQLSGHTHKGQLFPFSLITALFFHYHAGFFTLPNQSRLYVSRGTGTWGPPVRFLAPPEITVIDLVHKKKL
jgi:uncharacterized protein